MAIPESIKKKANKVRNEVYGKDVREALASGIEEAGDIADQANTKSNDAVEQVDNIQAQVNQLVIDGDSSVEAAQARVDEKGQTHSTLKDRIDDGFIKVNTQLAETTQVIESVESANSTEVLPITNYVGNQQNIHPKVLYFKDGWNGYKYWMAYTPYPDGNTEHENPCIAVSNDMITWTVPAGLENPLDPTPSQGYNSDTHLVYREDTDVLEIWWRQYVAADDRRIYRRTSSDGVSWTQRELVFQLPQNGIVDMLSPSIIFEDGKYKIWYCRAGSLRVNYRESIDENINSGWSDEEQVPINWWTPNLNPWHIDVISTDIGYEMVVQAYDRDVGTNNTSDLYYVIVKPDQNEDNYSNPVLILSKSNNPDSHDNKGIYRSSLLKIDDTYYLFYSSINQRGKRALSLSFGKDIRGLNGYEKRINKWIDMVDADEVENFEVSNIDMIRFSGNTTIPTVKSFRGGKEGQKLTLMIGTSNNKVLIKHSYGNIALPNNEDYLLDNNQRVLNLYYSSGFWRASAYKPPKPKFINVSTNLNDIDVSNVDILYIQDHITINSFAPSYFGKKVDLVVAKTAASATIKSGERLVPPGNEDYVLDISKIGMTCVCTAGGVWRCY